MTGDKLVATISFTDDCGELIDVHTLNNAALIMAGPRDPMLTQTAVKLLGSKNAPFAREINLINPAASYAVAGSTNLVVNADHSLTYTFNAVSTEAAGTYTVGVLAMANGTDGQADAAAQDTALAYVQVGTATVDPPFISGPDASSNCYSCHKLPGSKFAYMQHAQIGHYLHGGAALDMFPVAECKLCHNWNGYSPNPIIRKVHSVHRGAHQLANGVAHPDWANPSPAPNPWGVDATLAEFMDITFPSMPGNEKDCTACHADDRWKTAPSRAACGSCHDNLNFATGVFSPPSRTGVSCSTGGNATCLAANGNYTCDTSTPLSPTYNTCVLGAPGVTHPQETTDTKCGDCHPSDGNIGLGSYPISTVHVIPARTLAQNLQVKNLVLTPGSGPGGAMLPGDPLVIGFDVSNGVVAVNALTGNYSATALVSGPTDDRRLVYPQIKVATGPYGTLVSSGTGHYTFTFKAPATEASPAPFVGGFPKQSRDAFFSGLGPRDNPTGSYTLWLYVNQKLTVATGQGPVTGASFTDAANAVANFQYYATAPSPSPFPLPPIRGRAVVTTAACNSCHVDVQAHGGGRRDAAEQCSNCHNPEAMGRSSISFGARDFGYAQGSNCNTGNDCPLNILAQSQGDNSNSWESCETPDPSPPPYSTAPSSGPWQVCFQNKDATYFPIDFRQMIHNLHFARLRDGYNERNNKFGYAGHLVLEGSSGTLSDFSDILFPMDIRNCTKCHGDTSSSCSVNTDCAVGQACTNKKCTNVAWQSASAAACISCHDTADDYAHAQINTWTSPSGPVETCDVCHGQDSEFSVAKMHNVVNPYQQYYAREPGE